MTVTVLHLNLQQIVARLTVSKHVHPLARAARLARSVQMDWILVHTELHELGPSACLLLMLLLLLVVLVAGQETVAGPRACWSIAIG